MDLRSACAAVNDVPLTTPTSRDVNAIKDLIHQRNVVLAGANRNEGIQHSVRLNIDVIELVGEKNL